MKCCGHPIRVWGYTSVVYETKTFAKSTFFIRVWSRVDDCTRLRWVLLTKGETKKGDASLRVILKWGWYSNGPLGDIWTIGITTQVRILPPVLQEWQNQVLYHVASVRSSKGGIGSNPVSCVMAWCSNRVWVRSWKPRTCKSDAGSNPVYAVKTLNLGKNINSSNDI